MSRFASSIVGSLLILFPIFILLGCRSQEEKNATEAEVDRAFQSAFEQGYQDTKLVLNTDPEEVCSLDPEKITRVDESLQRIMESDIYDMLQEEERNEIALLRESLVDCPHVYHEGIAGEDILLILEGATLLGEAMGALQGLWEGITGVIDHTAETILCLGALNDGAAGTFDRMIRDDLPGIVCGTECMVVITLDLGSICVAAGVRGRRADDPAQAFDEYYTFFTNPDRDYSLEQCYDAAEIERDSLLDCGY